MATNSKEPELHNIEMLRTKNKVGWAVFAGVCAAQGWKPGKMVSEAEFREAVNKFTKGPPASRREVKK